MDTLLHHTGLFRILQVGSRASVDFVEQVLGQGTHLFLVVFREVLEHVRFLCVLEPTQLGFPCVLDLVDFALVAVDDLLPSFLFPTIHSETPEEVDGEVLEVCFGGDSDFLEELAHFVLVERAALVGVDLHEQRALEHEPSHQVVVVVESLEVAGRLAKVEFVLGAPVFAGLGLLVGKISLLFFGFFFWYIVYYRFFFFWFFFWSFTFICFIYII